MTKRKLLFFTLIWISPLLWGQKIDNFTSTNNINKVKYCRLSYENDLFAGMDENYTQGIQLEFVHPKLRKNPIHFLFFKPRNTSNKYGISLEHLAFTPYDYVSTKIQFSDRPFAGVISVNSFMMATDTIKKSRVTQSFRLGSIGTLAFAKEIQIGIHEVTKNDIPKGWHNQIKNDVVINYALQYERQLTNYRNIFALHSGFGLQFGSLYSNFSISATLTAGKIDLPFENLAMSKSSFYFFVQPSIFVVGYDATLQGGLFSKSGYVISQKDIKRFTYQNNFGVIFKTKNCFFEFSQSLITEEYKTGKIALWGGIKLGWTM